MNLPVERGAYMSQIVEDGPASKAGLIGSSDVSTYEGRAVEIGGDVIVAIDGNPIYSFDDLLTYISLNTSPGQEVTLTVLRNGQEKLITVTMESRPEDLSTPVQPSTSPSP
jgi:S1-C subfamily serine protease